MIPPPPMGKSSPVPADASEPPRRGQGLQSVTVLLPCADVKSGSRRSGVHPVKVDIGVAAVEAVSDDEALEASARSARYSIAAASNVLAILRVLANEQYVTLHRAAAEADVSVSTAYRLLSTLEANGLAERVRGGGYRPGAAALEWAGNLLHRLDARRIALPVIRGLPLLPGETGYLALLRTAGLTAVIILPADDTLPLPQNPVSLDFDRAAPRRGTRSRGRDPPRAGATRPPPRARAVPPLHGAHGHDLARAGALPRRSAAHRLRHGHRRGDRRGQRCRGGRLERRGHRRIALDRGADRDVRRRPRAARREGRSSRRRRISPGGSAQGPTDPCGPRRRSRSSGGSPDARRW